MSLTRQIPKTQKVVLIRENGGLDKILYEKDYPVPEIGEHEVLIKNRYAGINYVETYMRTGVLKSEKPYILGREASGVVVARGKRVKKFTVGDKVAYLGGKTFAQYTSFDSRGKIFKLDCYVTEEEMSKYAGALMNGFTVLTMITETYKVKKNDYILVHSVAGGCGLIFTQLIRERGGYVIGTASSEAKLKLAKEYGADYVINNLTEDIVARVMEITKGKGVAAVYDGIGKDTADISLRCLGQNGSFINYGQASGVIPPFDVLRLSEKNITISHPQLYGYLESREEWEYYSRELWIAIRNGLKIKITATFPLACYKNAAELMEARKTTGKLILMIPQ